jgi:cell division protein FtsB
MLQKLKNLSFIQHLNDVRFLGLLAFGVIALLVTWSGIKVVQTNYDLQKQISAMQQQNSVRKLENSNLALRNQYYETDQYLELVARKQFNKANPGEKLLIVPSSVALAHSKDLPLPEAEASGMPAPEDSGPWYERNFNAWMEFLFRREG